MVGWGSTAFEEREWVWMESVGGREGSKDFKQLRVRNLKAAHSLLN